MALQSSTKNQVQDPSCQSWALKADSGLIKAAEFNCQSLPTVDAADHQRQKLTRFKRSLVGSPTVIQQPETLPI